MHPKSVPKDYSNEKLLNMLLYGSEDFNYNMKKEMLKATIKFVKKNLNVLMIPFFDHS